jgi:uncharacterized membrane protein YbhN (UPF0104 family)
VLAVPPLRSVAEQIEHMSLAWVAVAVAVEIGSCVGYVVIFRLFFDQVPAGQARELAWTEEASGALLPTGGVGALAIGAWFLRQAGMSMLMLGYVIGYLANMLPVPGGFGVLESGLAGTLIIYGAPAAPAAAAVVVYHAVAFWIPSLGGLLGYARLRGRPTLSESASIAARPTAESAVASGATPPRPTAQVVTSDQR